LLLPDADALCLGFHGEYFGHWPSILKKPLDLILAKLRKWDLDSSQRVNFFLAISENVAQKIKNIYGRKVSRVIYPPVDTEFFTAQGRHNCKDYFLIVSALVPYKRINLAVEAFNRLGLPLIIIGEGPEKNRLERAALKNVKFLGWQAKDIIRRYYSQARALIFPERKILVSFPWKPKPWAVR